MNQILPNNVPFICTEEPHAPASPYKGRVEKSLINTLLVICLALGFLCITAIYLPSKLSSASMSSAQKALETPASNLLSVLPQENIEVSLSPPPQPSVNGTYIKFTPEPELYSPLYIAQRESHDSQQTISDPPSAPESRNENTKPSALTRIHRQSSLALYEPPKKLKSPKVKPWFTVPKALESDVDFWRAIYAKYDSHHVILHDPKYLSIVYGVIDFTDMDADTGITDIERSRIRQVRIDAERESITAVLEQLAADPSSGDTSKRSIEIRNYFDNIREADKFKNAAKRGVRAQTGQKDKFIEGLKYSGRYLGEIESIFEKKALPKELTFLIFVESMFNPSANSSAGAKGIWQFMRRTATIYNMKVNALIDERADPIRATYGAANLLQHDYDYLGSWPLAINAYNTGRGRMQQAMNRLGTTDIATIVKYFEHPAYGFASRNFYLEYLAAMDIAKNHRQYFGPINFDPPLHYDVVTLDRPARLNEIVMKSAISSETFKELNPALSVAVFTGKIPLPSGFELRVPEGKGEYMMAILARTAVAFPFWHTVENGQTLEDIASMYNIPAPDILRANKKMGRHLHAGQRIRITR